GLDIVSIKELPFIKIPFFEAPPIPAKNPKGTDITSAQGQEITRNVNALESQSVNSAPFIINGGIMASSNAAITTKGVKYLANFVMKFSVFAFFSAALSTSSSILAAVDSPNSFSVLIFKTPSRLMQPLIAELPAYTLRGTDSPVRADV